VCERIGTGARRLADTRAEEIAIGRFFGNVKVTPAEIIATAAQRTAEAAKGRHVLVIEDTTEVNYQSKRKRKRNLGTVGNGIDVGLFIHPAIALDAQDGSVLGVAAATIWRRTRAKQSNYQSLPIEEKESYRWLDTARAARDGLSAAAHVTVISDRESDIYEVHARLPNAYTDILIRANKDRAVTGPDGRRGRLFSVLSARPETGQIAFDLDGRPGRTKRRVVLSVRFCPMQLRQPRVGADRRDPRTVALHVIEVREIDPPAGEEPIHWRLLTTYAVDTLDDAVRLVDFYRLRWTIEQVFRTLKSQGFDVEDNWIAEGDELEKVAATALIAATQVMQLVHGRGEAGRPVPATRLFETSELEVLAGLTRQFEGKTEKQKNPHPESSLAWAAWTIARLGGWKGYAKARPPGPITFARGLQRFTAILEGYRLAQALAPHPPPKKS
jgi:hypothetical protein